MFEISASCSPCGELVVVLAMEGLLRPRLSPHLERGHSLRSRLLPRPGAMRSQGWRRTDCGPVSKAKSQVPRTAESLLVHPQMRVRLHDTRLIPAVWAGAPGARRGVHDDRP